MANRPRGIRFDRSLSLPMSRYTLRPTNQIFRTMGHARRTYPVQKRHSAQVTINSVNPILSPPSLWSISFARSEPVEAEMVSTPIMQTVSAVSSFPSPLPGLDMGSFSLGSLLINRLHPPASLKKLLLSTVPGFFGLMGLGHFYEKRSKRGAFFLGAGAALSTFSSWYTILPERIYSFISGTPALPPYALSWMSLFTGYNASLGEACIMLLAFIPALWALQVYDVVSPISLRVQSARRSCASRASPAAPMIPASPAAPMAVKVEDLKTEKRQKSLKSREEVDASVRKLAKDLTKTSSLFSYLWER
jgi:hypothetical protein